MKNVFKFLTIVVALTATMQTEPMMRKFACLSKAFGSRAGAACSTVRNAALSAKVVARAIKTHPALSRLTSAKTLMGCGAVAGLALYAKPAKAEGQKKEEPKIEPTFFQKMEANINEGLKLVSAALGLPQVDTPKNEVVGFPKVGGSPEQAQSKQPAKAQEAQSGLRPLQKEDLDKALGVAQSLIAQAKAEVDLEYRKRQTAYYDCMVNATMNRDQLKIQSYREACRLCAFRAATSKAFYPTETDPKKLDALTESYRVRAEKLSYLFPDTQKKLLQLEASTALQQEQAVQLKTAVETAKEHESFEKMAAELIAEQANQANKK